MARRGRCRDRSNAYTLGVNAADLLPGQDGTAKFGFMAKRASDFSDLSVEEKLQLIEDLWDSVADDPRAIPLTEAQAEELDRRLEAYRQDGDPGRPWREVLDELESHRK